VTFEVGLVMDGVIGLFGVGVVSVCSISEPKAKNYHQIVMFP
jgi:hypothetical protein